LHEKAEKLHEEQKKLHEKAEKLHEEQKGKLHEKQKRNCTTEKFYTEKQKILQKKGRNQNFILEFEHR
jgi:hypothetical protein